jgi:ABC-type nitrate/sulfonate/bicarbonate transport system substrate-binding protein
VPAQNDLSRRAFLVKLGLGGGALAATGLLQACTGAAPAPKPAAPPAAASPAASPAAAGAASPSAGAVASPSAGVSASPAVVAAASPSAVAQSAPTVVAAAGPAASLSVLETTPGFFDVPLYAMLHLGFAENNKLNLSIAQFQTGSGSSGQIFAGGTGDILMGGIDAPVGLHTSGLADVQVIGEWLQRGVWQLVSKAGSQYTSLQSLKGQVVAISGPGSFSDFALREAIKQVSMSPDDFQIAALGNAAAQYAALESGNAQAVQLQSPILEAQLRAKTVQVVFDFQKDLTPSLVVTARTAAVMANPVPYVAFMTAFRQVMQRMKADSAFALSTAKQAYGDTTPDSDLQLELDAYLSTPGIWSLDGTFTEELYNNGRSLLLDSGVYKAETYPSYQQLTQYVPKV